MRRLIRIAAAWLNIASLGLWFGAAVGIGALVAPVAFRLARPQAGLVLGESFKLLNFLGLGCAAVVLLATVAEALAWRLTRPSVVRLELVAIAAAIAGYLAWGMFPEMEALRAAGRMPEFDALHRRYEQISAAQLALLLAATLATAAALVGPDKSAVSERNE
jgi:uncharacterized protein DUF4149